MARHYEGNTKHEPDLLHSEENKIMDMSLPHDARNMLKMKEYDTRNMLKKKEYENLVAKSTITLTVFVCKKCSFIGNSYRIIAKHMIKEHNTMLCDKCNATFTLGLEVCPKCNLPISKKLLKNIDKK